MSRSLVARFVMGAVATAALLGCQKSDDGGSVVVNSKKYEAVDDEPTDDSGAPATPAENSTGSTPVADTGSPPSQDKTPGGGYIPSNDTPIVPPESNTDVADIGSAPDSGSTPAPKGSSEPPADSVAEANQEKGAADSGSGGATVSRQSSPSGPTAQASKGERTPTSIPFSLKRDGAGITMASYDPPKNATPKQLLDHLRNLARCNIKGRNQQEQMSDLAQLMQGRILTSELLMNSSSATMDERLLAVNTKIETLGLLSQMGNPNVLEHAKQFASALKNHPEKELASKGRIVYLSLAAGELVDPANSDASWVVGEIQAVIEEEPVNIETCETLQEAIGRLVGAGKIDEAMLCGEKMLAAYAKSEDEPIKQRVAVLRDELGLIKLDFAKKLEAAMTGKDGSLPALLSAAETAAKLDTRGRATIQVLAQSGQFMEFAGQYEVALKIYDALGEAYKDWPEKETRESVQMNVSTAKKRLSLIGKPFSLDNEIYGGGQLDWEKYKGKTVLVDFWATWCIPCLREMPNIRAHYERYKDRGFEVIGYNLDEDPKQLDRFFKNQSLPWPSVLGKDPAKRGFGKDEFANSLGIDGIPFVMLINKDGVVEAIHVRGIELSRQLERLLGPPDAKPETTPEKTESTGDPSTP